MRLIRKSYSELDQHIQDFRAACPGWAIPFHCRVSHYFNVNGVSLCLNHDAMFTWETPHPETTTKKCRACQRALTRGATP